LLYKYNNISLRNNQEKTNYFNVVVEWLKGNQPELKDPDNLLMIHKVTHNDIKLLTMLLRLMGVFHQTYVSQERLAKLTGVHHDTVWRRIKLFVALGLIKKQYRGANKTCVYSIGSVLHDTHVRYALKDVIPNLYWSVMSTVSRCKQMLGDIIMPLTQRFTPDTARLFNNNNKELNTRKKLSEKEEIRPLSQADKQKLDYYLEQEQKKKVKLQNEFAQILGFI